MNETKRVAEHQVDLERKQGTAFRRDVIAISMTRGKDREIRTKLADNERGVKRDHMTLCFNCTTRMELKHVAIVEKAE